MIFISYAEYKSLLSLLEICLGRALQDTGIRPEVVFKFAKRLKKQELQYR